MNIETYQRDKYQIIKVRESGYAIENLTELHDLITGYVKRGKAHIAISFGDASYIYSGAITVLIDCYHEVESHGGSLSIIEPDPGLFDILETLNINAVIKIYVSEEYLP